MKLYNFTRLIKKYNVEFSILAPSEKVTGLKPIDIDDLGNPILIPMPIVWENANGALIPPTDSEIYQSGGRLTRSDRILYYQGGVLPSKTKVTHKGKYYYVEGDADFLDFGDFYRYNLKGVDAFND